MAKYDDFKTIAVDALNTLADASVEAYKVAEEKTRILARKTKLRAGIVNEKAVIRRLSVELGTKYYNKYKDDEGADFASLCKEITGAYDRIVDKELEIAELKAAGAYPKTAEPPSAAPQPEATPAPEPECSALCCPETDKETEE